MGKIYNKDSIKSLSPLEFTRHSPGVYAGSTLFSNQLVLEILSNAIDEHRIGHGVEITIVRKVLPDGVQFTVQDEGQGFLVNSIRDDGETVFQAAFDVMNTSGKYDEDGVYQGNSLGAFGIGSKLTTFLSHRLQATTVNNGMVEQIDFIEGVFSGNRTIREAEKDESHGTTVTWIPSEEFFENPDIDKDMLVSVFKQQCALNPRLTIKYYHNGDQSKPDVFSSPRGLVTLLDDAAGKPITAPMVMNFSKDAKHSFEMAFQYTSDWKTVIIPFVNSGLTESGPHITTLKSLFTREFNKFFKTKDWGQEDKLTGDDIQDGLYCVFNIVTTGHSYDAQVKSRITRLDMTPFTKAITDELWVWMESNEKDLKAIYDKATTAKKARDAEKRVREKIRAAAKEQDKPSVRKFDSKLAACSSKNRQECSLICTEGDSASGNLKMIRDRKTIAVMPLRGKILNCEKASLEKMLENQEIMTMIQAFGLSWDPITLRCKFDKKKLQYGKIVIMADGDTDGNHIRILFYTFIWKICPELITEGYIYAGLAPLYRIVENKNNFIYLWDDNELKQYQASHAGKKYEVFRFKGLGEMMPQQLWETTMDPSTRTLLKATIEDAANCDKLFDILMGDKVEPRRKFIEDNAVYAQNIDT